MLIMNRMKVIMGISLILISKLSYAVCVQETYFGSGHVRGGAKTDVAIYSHIYQPVGSTLGYEYISPSGMASQLGIPVDQVLFKCDLADRDKIYQKYFLPYGYGYDNYEPMEPIVDNTHYFKTNMKGLMFNFFIGNGANADTQFYSNYHGNSNIKKVPIGYDIDPNDNQKILIKLKHYEGFTTKEVRSSEVLISNSYEGPVGVVYRGMILFSGPGINENDDANNLYAGIPLAMRKIYGRLNNTCGVSRVTPTVNLGVHSAADIPTTPVNFSVDVECERGATNVRYGFIPSEENRASNEQDFLLLDPSSGATAKGVAIEILNSGGSRVKLLSLGAEGAQLPPINNWVPISVPSGVGTELISLSFSARYVKYPAGGHVTPGNANSKATFLINME